MNLWIRIAEWLLVRIQDRLGIPRWWLVRTLMNLYVCLQILEWSALDRFDAFAAFWAVVMIAMWSTV